MKHLSKRLINIRRIAQYISEKEGGFEYLESETDLDDLDNYLEALSEDFKELEYIVNAHQDAMENDFSEESDLYPKKYACMDSSRIAEDYAIPLIKKILKESK